MIFHKTLEICDQIFMNSSEHSFNFSFTEILLIKNIAKKKNYELCTQLGGCESIRDIQQAKTVGAKAVECRFVETLFSYKKLINSLEPFCLDMQANVTHPLEYIFLEINTLQSINDMKEILEFHNLRNSSYKLIPVLERRSIAKDRFSITSDSFELSTYEEALNSEIQDFSFLNQYNFCISGGVTGISIEKLLKLGLAPKYIKTGLFTFGLVNPENRNLSTIIEYYQMLESIALDMVKHDLSDKYNYVSSRQHRLFGELLEKKWN